VVAKRRTLYLYERTRIHLDRVADLGDFVELETVVTDQPEAAAHAELAHVATALALRPEDAVSAAYVDLLAHA
jgi:predicted adenylyl cyclase CyaB